MHCIFSQFRYVICYTVVVVHDAENFYTKHRLSPEVVKALRFPGDNTKTVLNLNKVRFLFKQYSEGDCAVMIFACVLVI